MRRDRGPGHQPEGRLPARRERDPPSHAEPPIGQDHGARRAAGQHGTSRVGVVQGGFDGAAGQDVVEEVGLAAREVDEVGLADGLGVGRVLGGGSIADEDRLDLGAQRAEVLPTHLRPAQEDLLAIGHRGGRQDDHARAGAPRRDQQLAVDGLERGRELPGPDQGDGAVHREAVYGRDLIPAARARRSDPTRGPAAASRLPAAYHRRTMSDSQRPHATTGLRALLIDIDGVLVLRGAPIPGARDALTDLTAMGLPFRLATNTSAMSRRSIADHLTSVGLPVERGSDHQRRIGRGRPRRREACRRPHLPADHARRPDASSRTAACTS